MEPLEWIQKWYLNQCDGEWENEYAIRINSLDNPGWYVSIGLEFTELEERPFDTVEIYRSEDDWIICKVGYEKEAEGKKFMGGGGPLNLEEILRVFQSWSDSP